MYGMSYDEVMQWFARWDELAVKGDVEQMADMALFPINTVTDGQVLYEGRDLLALPTEERAREGVFLAMQYPIEIPGVSNSAFLRLAYNTVQDDTFATANRVVRLARRRQTRRVLNESASSSPSPAGGSAAAAHGRYCRGARASSAALSR